MTQLPNGDKLLTIKDVAVYLGVCPDSARVIVKELPHGDASGVPDAKQKTLLILESVLMGYLAGEIKRVPTPDHPMLRAADIKRAKAPKGGGYKPPEGLLQYRRSKPVESKKGEKFYVRCGPDGQVSNPGIPTKPNHPYPNSTGGNHPGGQLQDQPRNSRG